MKKLFIACAMLAASSMVSFAQSTSKAPSATVVKMAQQAAQSNQKALGLTKQQYDAVYKAELSYYQQDEQARANGGHPGPGQSMQMAMGRDQQYKAVLTSEQFTKYQSIRPNTGMPNAPQAQPAQQMAH